MRMIGIKNCQECPYFDNAMDDNEENFGKLRLICLKKNKGYETGIYVENNINCLEYETNEEIDKMIHNLNFDIPDWCPLEKIDRGDLKNGAGKE